MTRFTNSATGCASRHGFALLRWLFLWVLPLFAAAPAWADDCGKENIRPCTVAERLPSCDLNLVEAGGRCVRPLCGAQGQRPCSAFERTVFDLVLRMPTPQACDWDLKVVNGACVHPNCGREGQKACDVFTRLPSCDLNLVETASGCVHPQLCGREGQPLCALTLRGPLRICDANLVDRAGQCARPGTPDNPVTSAQGQPPTPAATNSRPPPLPPRTGLPPPPPPPPPPAIAPTSPPPASPQITGGLETDTDRQGSDMLGFNLAQADPAMCQSSCTFNAQCLAWTYVKPGIQGPAPRCYLKNAMPAPTRNNCCVSGVKSAPAAMLPKR